MITKLNPGDRNMIDKTNAANDYHQQRMQLSLDLMDHVSLLKSIETSEDNLSEIIDLQIKQLECFIEAINSHRDIKKELL